MRAKIRRLAAMSARITNFRYKSSAFAAMTWLSKTDGHGIWKAANYRRSIP
jgi:hypothetical protein